MILTRDEILKRIFSPESEDSRLVVTPLLSLDQVSEGSVDLRLDSVFIKMKTRKISEIDPINPSLPALINEFQEKIHVPPGESLIIHPGEFILGGTLEYLSIPPDLFGNVVGKSSWGRLGLVIETAPVVHPNYKGILTLEIVNVGNVPIELYPGAKIAQLYLNKMEEPERPSKKARYRLNIEATFSKIYKDDDWNIIRRMRKFS